MQSTTTTIRRFACAAGLALIGLTTFAGGAAGGSGPSSLECESARAQACMTDAEYRALLIRSMALNRKYGPGG
jgi:hypothetical protein